MKPRILCALLLLALFRSASAQEAGADLNAQLEGVQTQIAAAQTNLAAVSKEVAKIEHDLEYSDPACKALREEMVVLEKQLIAKRDQLAAHRKSNPDYSDAESRRKEAFLALQSLRATEQLIKEEIARKQGGQPQNP